MPEPICLRCGKCCHYFNDNGKVKKCKYLVKTQGKTICRIYPTRLRHPIDILKTGSISCGWRKEALWDYEGCPYNTDKQIFPNNV